MSTIHIFNPEHEMVLEKSGNLAEVPHAVRAFRSNLSFLPALWAEDGDVVMVDEMGYALKAVQPFLDRIARVRFLQRPKRQPQKTKWVFRNPFEPDVLEVNELVAERIDAWGNNSALHDFCNHYLLVHDDELSRQVPIVREMARRAFTVSLLHQLTSGIAETVGEREVCTSLQQVEDFQQRHHGAMVLKSMWSSSGRGVRMINRRMSDSEQGWVSKCLSHHHGIVAEPLYNKVIDFAMEMEINSDGSVSYLGLSVFTTYRGAYKGNLLATEEAKMEKITRFLPERTVMAARDFLCRLLSRSNHGYRGPLGVDMMVVRKDGHYFLHPCVEINFRRTMGHVALLLSTGITDSDIEMQMVIEHKDNYYLRILPCALTFAEEDAYTWNKL